MSRVDNWLDRGRTMTDGDVREIRCLYDRIAALTAKRDALAAQVAAISDCVLRLIGIAEGVRDTPTAWAKDTARQLVDESRAWREDMAQAAATHNAAVRRATLERAVEAFASLLETHGLDDDDLLRAVEGLRAEMDEKQ